MEKRSVKELAETTLIWTQVAFYGLVAVVCALLLVGMIGALGYALVTGAWEKVTSSDPAPVVAPVEDTDDDETFDFDEPASTDVSQFELNEDTCDLLKPHYEWNGLTGTCHLRGGSIGGGLNQGSSFGKVPYYGGGDLDCTSAGVGNNIATYGSDPHGFDGDGDGIGCES